MAFPDFYYRFSKSQQKGIIALCFLLLFIQAVYYISGFVSLSGNSKKSEEEKLWLAHQAGIDSLKAQVKDTGYVLYPFNPNFISDYKGYTLGMSVKEIDRLHTFRKSGKYVNSAQEFKTVTGVSDSLLATISPYFKFPDWVQNKKPYTATPAQSFGSEQKLVRAVISKDINTALEEDLVAVYGIGPYFAKKLLRRRADLGAFVSMEQMDDFTEFSPEAVAGLKKMFTIGNSPQVNRINVNTASLQQLSCFPYFNRDIAKAIITQRSMKGKITNFAELSKINDIFKYKSKIILLYLEF